MEEKLTIPLSRPITHDGKEWKELTFRELTLGDMVEMEKLEGGIAQNALAISLTSGLPLAAVHMLKSADYRAIMQKGGAILGNVETGEGGET